MKNKFSIALSLAMIVAIAITVMGSAAELVTAELDASTANCAAGLGSNDVTVTQGSSANFTLYLCATGKINAGNTSLSPSTARVKTSYTLAGGALSSSNFSNAVAFFAAGTGCSGANCDITWTGAPTPYAIAATVSADTFTAVGTYTITLSESAGTTQTVDPNSTGAKLDDTTATTITVHVVAPIVTNTSPSVTVTGVVNNANYDKGSVPAAICDVTDAEDGNSSFAATLSAITGPYAADGIGDQTASCSYTDAGGLTASAQATYHIVDPTPPVIVPTVTGTLGNNGWYVSDVIVSWAVSDPDSTISSTLGCDPTTISADTAGTPLTCTATSAGGQSSQSVTIKRDATAPTGVTGAPVRVPDFGSWYNSAVNVVFTGSDAPAGIASCSPISYSGPDAAGVTVNGSCTDNAGNIGYGVSSAFNYDATAPTNVALSVTAGTLGLNGWYTSDVTIHTSSDADVSGVTCTSDQYQTDETAAATFNGSCINGAGLTTNAAPLTVKLDKSAPVATLTVLGTLGNNGWYVSDVTIQTTGSDTISDPTSCSANQSLTTDTTGTAFSGSCTNDAGLTANTGSVTVKRDVTKPTLAPSVSPNPVVLNGSATASPNATDATSGVASSSCDAVDTSTIGVHSVTCYATDNAGNSNSASYSYSVIFNWSGFFQPIDNGALNVAKSGSAIPVKFSLSGNQGLNIFQVGYPRSTRISCDATAFLDEIETTVTAGGSSLTYDVLSGQYIYVWKTDKSWVGTCRQLQVTLTDGTTHTANFKFK